MSNKLLFNTKTFNPVCWVRLYPGTTKYEYLGGLDGRSLESHDIVFATEPEIKLLQSTTKITDNESQA